MRELVIQVREDDFHAALILPGYFMEQKLSDVKQVFTIICRSEWQNESTIEALNIWLEEWVNNPIEKDDPHDKQHKRAVKVAKYWKEVKEKWKV